MGLPVHRNMYDNLCSLFGKYFPARAANVPLRLPAVGRNSVLISSHAIPGDEGVAS